MAGIADIGNSKGYIYVTKTDGTTVLMNLVNDANGERKAKLFGLEASAVGANTTAVGKVAFTFSPVPASGTISAVTIDGVNQIVTGLSLIGLPNTDIASKLADLINNFKPATGHDYTAQSLGLDLFIFAMPGSAANGKTISITSDVPLVPPTAITTTPFSGGADSTSIFSAQGYRFFLNANYNGTAAEGVLTNAIEITDFIILQGLQNSFKEQQLGIVSDYINPLRKAAISIVVIDTEGLAATDNLDRINGVNAAEGDILIVRGKSPARITTIVSTANIKLQGGNFLTGDAEKTLVLQRTSKHSASNVLWVELFRSSTGVPAFADFRTNNFPFTTKEGTATIVAPASGTITLTANTDFKWQKLTGTVALTGNLSINISAVSAVKGDEFIISSTANITVGAFTLTVGSITITPDMAFNGGWIARFYFDGTTWLQSITPNLFQGTTFKIDPQFIADGSVVKNKLETSLTKELIVVEHSFETGEQGDNKIEMNYPGTIQKIFVAVKKVLGGVDTGTVTIKNNALAVMGTITIPLSAPVGTALTVVPTSNNTFVADDDIIVTTTKTTSGGKITVTLHIAR